MKIQVLGSGCPKCNQLMELVKKAADELGVDYELEKVTEITEFVKYGVAMTPALVVDGELKLSGRLPKLEELKAML